MLASSLLQYIKLCDESPELCRHKQILPCVFIVQSWWSHSFAAAEHAFHQHKPSIGIMALKYANHNMMMGNSTLVNIPRKEFVYHSKVSNPRNKIVSWLYRLAQHLPTQCLFSRVRLQISSMRSNIWLWPGWGTSQVPLQLKNLPNQTEFTHTSTQNSVSTSWWETCVLFTNGSIFHKLGMHPLVSRQS